MPTVSPVRLAIMLGTLVALGPLAIDTYLPALPTMADDFGVAVHAVELSVSFYVIGVALGQWLGGPLSDHFGRKPVAYVGLLVFFLASLAIALRCCHRQRHRRKHGQRRWRRGGHGLRHLP